MKITKTYRMSEDVLEKIDRLAVEGNVSRTRVIEDAVRIYNVNTKDLPNVNTNTDVNTSKKSDVNTNVNTSGVTPKTTKVISPTSKISEHDQAKQYFVEKTGQTLVEICRLYSDPDNFRISLAAWKRETGQIDYSLPPIPPPPMMTATN